MSQTSGSIVIDTSSMAAAVVAALEPVFRQISTDLNHLAGLIQATALDSNTMTNVISDALPAEVDAPYGAAIGLAANLEAAGYALVPVSGDALVQAAASSGITSDLGGTIAQAADQLAREDEWFRRDR